ncbi:NAD(P)-dependent oxidoreductase [Streptomyces sp. B1866]|uniref:NAD-dependent epimerase/dehydratase family protein n=1 Tax=Streptomyces sp. B1866 TaxID=3075431 RepID=UPI00288E557D|nr:NAD(P)-dependent oxidoreductase [Streptomyces sp. B1866]MDT3397735.1 NAD(P)-dependent oxidoreductase [Streptomyces sp. B1866]
MRILVTGATGRVGRRLVPRLLAWRRPGDGVRVLVRDAERGAPFASLGAEVAVGDLRDYGDARAALDGADVVVNVAAAFRGVPDEEAWAVNRDAAVGLARAAASAGDVRFVQVSTILVYGAGRGRMLAEDDEPVPGGPMWGAYAASKAEADRDLLGLHRDLGLDVRIGRLAFVYGDGDPHLAESLGWAGGWAGNQRMAMVHHADVAQALLRLARAPRAVAAGRAYNIAADAPATAVELHQINGAAVPEGMWERADTDPWFALPATGRLREDLGWRPLYPSMWTARDAGAL